MTALLVALAGCGESNVPGSDTDHKTGIWFMASPWTRRIGGGNGQDIACRPMLMQMTITRESLALGSRVFPCNEFWHSFDALTLQRSGDKLLRNGENVGTLNERRLEIQLSQENRRIVWDLDAINEPYTEITAIDEFRMEPRLQDDAAPFATDVAAYGREDEPVKGFVHAVRLPEADIWYQQYGSPFYGKMAYFDVSTGEFRFDPGKDFDGATSFSFKVFTDGWAPTIAEAHISFMGSQDPPRALDVYGSASEDSPTIIAPNATDPDGDKLTFEVFDPPMHGKVEVTFDSFLYTAEPDFNGVDSFTYFAWDGMAQSNIAKVQIAVIKTNDPPVIIDQDIAVTNESATPFSLRAIDNDSAIISYEFLTFPQYGAVFGTAPDMVYIPPAGVKNGVEELTYRAKDQSTVSAPGKIRFIISQGTHPCSLLTQQQTNPMVPVWNDGTRIFYTSRSADGMSYLGKTDGTLGGTDILQAQWADVSGFDNQPGQLRHTIYFQLGPWLYFSATDKQLGNVYMQRTDGVNSWQLPLWISPPSNEIKAEPQVGDVFVDGTSAYFPLSWPRSPTEHACQIQRLDLADTNQTTLVHSLPPANGPCFGLWNTSSAHYLFAGSNLLKFNGIQSAPEILKDLGNAKPEPWMVAVGDKLFFQTRTDIGNETRIELWVTDGTDVGTKSIKELETAFLEFNIFSPLAFANKLYFAHRKSLWSSDGTEAGTSIVKTIPTNVVIGDGAIGGISAINGKLYFLATSDAFGREPWVSDGTPAGTQLLLDISPGTKGSAAPSSNPAYFHAWNGQILFIANDGGAATGLWATDGTSAGTTQITARSMNTILGILGNKLIFRDANYAYAMKLL